MYTVTCRRSGDWWAITVPDLTGVHSQARRLDKVAQMAREAIALMLDVDPATIEVDVRPHVPARVAGALKARQVARDAKRRADEATREGRRPDL